ncbi:plasma serine protease inhibitor-like [Dendropsophus ebraccatus]|uniref:plasma serine protease inhibitor-like n=1 Tax=Dendropsophus ebraccatus TaxID=150705 RepID=UPI0038317C1A
MKLFLLVCVSQVLLCALVIGQPEADDDQQKLLAPSIETFTGKLYSQVVTTHPKENLFFSPLSISIAFSLLSLGAKADSRRQILEGLGFDTSVDSEDIYKGFQQLLENLSQPNSELELNINNALFVAKDLVLQQTFQDNAKKFYQSDVISTDFRQSGKATAQINSYVEEKTKGKIKDLLSQLDVETVLVLINTIFFKGSWKVAFNINNTRKQDFHVDEKTVVKVPMMTRKGEYSMASIPKIGCTVVKIPYKGNFSAIFIIPNKGKMQKVEKAFQEGSLRSWIQKLKPKKIKLSIPKFSFSLKLDLIEELTPIGFTNVFSSTADLSGIAEGPRLEVSQAVHKAVIEVDEEGTVAAAATAIGIVATSIVIYPEVTANRPFILTIVRDDDNLGLFTGKLINPTL